MEIVSFAGTYAFLSNFYLTEVCYKNHLYPSTEHAFQAAKTFSLVEQSCFYIQTNLQNNITPGKAKRLGKKVTLRSDWDWWVKLAVMEDILNIKFQDPVLRMKLLATGDAKLVEGNYWHDTFWGVCDGQGLNHLGRILMYIRNKIRTETLKI